MKPYLSDVDINRTLVVLGPWAPAEPLESMVPNVHRVPAGTYCTSVWLDLARHQETWVDQYEALVLCDTDPRTGLCQAALLRRRPAVRS